MIKSIKKIICLGIIFGLLSHFYIIQYSTSITYNSDNNYSQKEKGTPNSHNLDIKTNVVIDPEIMSLKETDPSLMVNLIINYQPNYQDFIRQRIIKEQLGIILQTFDSFNLFKIQSRLENVDQISKLTGISSIFLDSAKEILSYNQNMAQKWTATSRFQLANNSRIDLQEFLEIDQLATEFGISNPNILGNNTIITILDAGIDRILENYEYFDQFNKNFSQYFEDINQNFLQFDASKQNITFDLHGAVSMVPYEPLSYTDFRGSGTYYAGLVSGTGKNVTTIDPISNSTIDNITYTGIAPQSSILNVKVLDSIGFTYYSFILSGLEWALNHDTDVILIPWEFPGFSGDPITVAVKKLVEKGIVVVVAAGDNGPAYTSTFSPAQEISVIRVGAFDQNSQKIANFSSRGPTFNMETGIDLIAPSIEIPGPTTSYEANQTGITITNRTGSGVAAALVAGGSVVLKQLFPEATPEMIKIAFMKTAKLISPEYDPNAEGFGLMNLTAAALFLSEYLETNYNYYNRTEFYNFYPGIITNFDVFELGGISPGFTDENDINLFALTGNQALMTALLVMNQSQLRNLQNGEIPDIHLPLNLFGFSFNDSYISFLELETKKEMDVLTKFETPSFYMSYASVLSYLEELFIAIKIESWTYGYESNSTWTQENWNYAEFIDNGFEINETSQMGFNITERIPAFKFTFAFINKGSNHYHNLTLHSMFKSDLYLNEMGIQNLNDMSSKNQDLLSAGYDDMFHFDSTSQSMLTVDQFNNDTFVGDWTTFGVKALNHSLYGWEINETDQIFNEMFSNQIPRYSNSSSPKTNTSLVDIGFKMAWFIDHDLKPGEIQSIELVMSLGRSHNRTESENFALETLFNFESKTDTQNIIDLAVITTTIPRMNALDNEYYSEAWVINLGNQRITNVDTYFLINKTSTALQQDWVIKKYTMESMVPFQIAYFYARWDPVEEGLYTVNWQIGGFNNLVTLFDDASFNNYLTCVSTIYNYKHLESHLVDLILITPYLLPFQPFLLRHPLDMAMINITIISPILLSKIEIEQSGIFTNIVSLSKTDWFPTSLYERVSINILIPMAYYPTTIVSNLNFYINNHNYLHSIPIQFSLKENYGRFLFDGIHSYVYPEFSLDTSILDNLDVKIEGSSISGGLDFNSLLADRLETLYGNYFIFHNLLSDKKPKGYSLTQIISGLDLTDSLTELVDMEDSFSVGNKNDFNDSLALQQIFKGDNFFSSIPEINTDYYSYDLIKFFDSLIFVDPEIKFNKTEIAAFNKYLSLGGKIFLFVENQTKEDIQAANSLLNPVNLQISNQTFGKIPIKQDEIFISKSQTTNHTFYLEDPLKFSLFNNSQPAEHINFINDYMVNIDCGKGDLIVVGDTDFLKYSNLSVKMNQNFTLSFIELFLDNRFEWDHKLYSNQLDPGQTTYISFNQQNQSMNQYLEEDLLIMATAINKSGDIKDLEIFGFSTPILPLIKTNATAFFSQINASIFNPGEEIWIGVMIDSPHGLSETFSFKLNISKNPVITPIIEKYYAEPLLYPKFLEIVFVGLLVFSLILFYSYSTAKWRLRHRYVPITEDMKAKIETKLSTFNQTIKQLEIGIRSTKLDEIEKIRFISDQRERIEAAMKNIFDLASELGEY